MILVAVEHAGRNSSQALAMASLATENALVAC